MCQVQNNGLGPIDGGPPNPDVYSTACSCSDLYSAHASTLISTFQDRVGPVTETLTTFTDSSYQPPDNCCIKCWISASDVQIIYWPVETAPPDWRNGTATTSGWNATSALPRSSTITAAPTPYHLVQDGFTYISPSVYVAYHDLQAYAVCPSFGGAYSRGRSYNTTIAYAPNQLSTSICTTGSQGIQPIGYGHFAAINFTDYQYSTSAWSQCAKEIEAGSGGSRSIEGPFYSIPGDVSLIDPAWSTCSAVFNGVFDPPRMLDPAPALLTGGGSGSSPAAPTPAPAHAPAPALVPPTPTPSLSNSPTSDPPANNPPANNPPANNPPANNPPATNEGDPPSQQGGNQEPSSDENSTIMVLPQPANADPTPVPNAVLMNSPSQPAPVTANGVTISRVLASPGSGFGAGDSGSGGSDTNGAGGVVIGGVTYSNGASSTLPGPNGALLSVASDHVVVGGSSYTLPAAASPSPVLIAGNSISRGPGGGLVFGTSTIDPGTLPTTVYGHAISVGQSSAVIDGSAYALPGTPSNGATLANSAITLGNGAVLNAGAAPTIVSGTTVALVSNGASLLVNGHSFSIPPAPLAGPFSASPILDVGGQTFTAAETGFAVGGRTVSPGGAAITVGGTLVSLGPSGQLVVGSSTTTLASASTDQLLTVGGQKFLAASTGFAIGSQTIAPGGAPVTISGTVVSLGPSGKLVIGSETTTLPSGGVEVEESVGGVVIEAPIVTGTGGAVSEIAKSFTGNGTRLRITSLFSALMIVLGALIT